MTTPSEKIRDRWLEQLLPLVPSEGWSIAAIRMAAHAAELSEGEQVLAAPNGATDLLDHFFECATKAMRASLADGSHAQLRTHERVREGMLAWLKALEPNREAVRKAAGQSFLPRSAGAAVRRVWAIADAVWDVAGDTATDYNRQTKRSLLSSVIPAIVLYWLDGPSEERLSAYIDKRLSMAMKLGQAGSRVLGPVLDAFDSIKPKAEPSEL